jgi:hypothetical protein
MKFKTLLATTLLFFLFIANTHAQEKYVYASVTLNRSYNGNFLSISKAGDYQETKLGNSDFKSTNMSDDMSALLTKVNDLAKDGWEVYWVNNTLSTSSSTSFQVVYYLRKKG